MSINTEIITIGDEILIGQTLDTNSAWLGERLNAYGYNVVQVSTIQDKPAHIVRSLDLAKQRADLIIMTGGLGPTKDDRTKKTLAEYFNSELVISNSVLTHIRKLLGSRKVSMNQLNKDQALIPEGCQILNNSEGTAPGMLFRDGKTTVVSLPGVPYEMKSICEKELFPWLRKNVETDAKLFRMVMTTGYPESILAAKLKNWEEHLPDNCSLAYLPSPGIVKLRLNIWGESEDVMETSLEKEINKLQKIIPKAIYSYVHEGIEEKIGEILKKMHRTVGTAESCTGGNIAKMLTSVPGSSAYYKGSVLAYAYETKRDLLGIDQDCLNKYGAVSEQVIRQMAEKARRLLNVDYAVATSGIAGPGGGTDTKPVGTVCLAVASKDQVIAKRFQFGSHRGRNIERSSVAALNILRKIMLADMVKNQK
jgi:nicotinamide-nucleotide amidase